MKKKFSLLAGLCMLASFVSPAKDNNENGEVPLFKENKGQLVDQHSQSRQDIQYYGSSDGLSYFFKNTGISYQLYKNETDDKVLISRIDMTWEGANTHAKIISANKAITTDNFYNTPQPDGITGVRNYGDLQYKDIYAGIDLHYYYKNGSLKYDFIVAPGADYKNIQIKVAGATSLLENKDGTISIKTPSGVLTEGMPVAYQNGREIKTSWILEKDVLSFQLSEYNAALPVVIDPLVYQWNQIYNSPNTGGLSQFPDAYRKIALDDFGNIYTTWFHHAPSWWTGIEKKDATGNGIWSLYFALNGNIVDISTVGTNIYVCGYTGDNNLATTGAYQIVRSGSYDGLLTKYDSSGTKLWSTYYGGTNVDSLTSCKSDAVGNVYVCGVTNSSNNLSSSNASQATFGGGSDAFVAKFNANGNRVWGTYLGGNNTDYASKIDVCNNRIFIAGSTKSTSNIASGLPHQSTYNGSYSSINGLLSCMDTSGAVQWTTYYGADSTIARNCIADSNYVYLSGETNSNINIATSGTYQATKAGGADVFLAKFNFNGVRQWGTYYGGTTYESADGLAIGKPGTIYIYGNTKSSTGIATANAYGVSAGSVNNGGVAYLAELDTNGFLTYGTYLNAAVKAVSCVANKNGDVFFAGGNDPMYSSLTSMYLMKFSYCNSIISTPAISASLNNFCSGSSSQLSTPALTGASYYWYRNSLPILGVNSNIYNATLDGVYSVKVQQCGTMLSPSTTLTTIPAPITQITKTDVACASASNGNITVTASGGLAPYSYSWNNSTNISATLSSLVLGSYIVHTSDANSCVKTDTITIINTNQGPSTQITKTNVACANASNGSIIVTASGGTAPYNYSWDNNTSTSATLSGLNLGSYIVHTTDANSCVKTDTVNIINANQIPSTQITKTDAPCSSATLGSIVLTTSNGTPPYTYTWDNSTNTTSTLTGLTPGSYIVHTSDVNNCSKTDTVTILNTHNEPVTVMSHTNVPCYGAPIGSATVAASGGTTPYSYVWDGQTATTATITGLATGNYKVLVTDANNCMATDSTIVTQDTSIAPSDPLVSLCAVTVDSATGKNIIFWNKTGDVRATSYNIYREGTASGNYELVGSKSVTDFASIIDTASIPLQQSYSYKVAEVDSCGHEWPLSDLHKTIHLSSNVGVNGENNLSWNIYEGRPYTTHNIWRSFNGAPFTLLNQVSSTITSYSDLTPPTGNNVYRIEIDLGVSCDSLNPGSQHITSNKVSLGTNTTGINGIAGLGNVQIVPNPTKGILHILGEMPAQIKLYDALGRLVTEERNVNKMDIGKFSKGMYMIQLFDKNGAIYHSQKVLLN